jgi:rhodanese-related sulfurtransferase
MPIMAERELEIQVQKARNLLQSNTKALLVCAYENENDFHKYDLEGAISLQEFQSRVNTLSKKQPIIFYCACPHDEGALALTDRYRSEGFVNAQSLQGGFNAWKDAGYPVASLV